MGWQINSPCKSSSTDENFNVTFRKVLFNQISVKINMMSFDRLTNGYNFYFTYHFLTFQHGGKQSQIEIIHLIVYFFLS